tara:strand:+ start:1381 stop:1815 length:435 start_codon:yes stop_codon:yes gene_type:complete
VVILPAFSVVPKKTFVGLDKGASHCFTVKKSLTNPFIEYFQLKPGNLQQEIIFVTEAGEFPATLRLIIQDKSKPNKIGIKRNWKNRRVLNISWKGKDSTTSMMQKNLSESINLIRIGARNNRQSVSFEHLGTNRFFISFQQSNL